MIETAEKSDHETGMAIIVVAAALRDSEGRILIQRRPAHKNHGGLWEFPGGKLEQGETPEAALVREIAEELGAAIAETALTPIGFSTAATDQGAFVLLLYGCTGWQGAMTAQWADALAWVAPDKLHLYPMPPADIPLIAAIKAWGRL